MYMHMCVYIYIYVYIDIYIRDVASTPVFSGNIHGCFSCIVHEFPQVSLMFDSFHEVSPCSLSLDMSLEEFRFRSNYSCLE